MPWCVLIAYYHKPDTIRDLKLDNLLEAYNAVKQERDLLVEKNNSLLIHIGNIETENSLLKQNKETVRKRIEAMLTKLES